MPEASKKVKDHVKDECLTRGFVYNGHRDPMFLSAQGEYAIVAILFLSPLHPELY